MMNSFAGGPFVSPFIGFGLLAVFTWILTSAVVIAILTLKGYALWYAAKRDERWWFVVLLIINTAGILDLVYLIFVVKKWQVKVTDKFTHPHAHNHTHTHEHKHENK